MRLPVISSSKSGEVRTITASPAGASCDCPGFAIAGFCRHIDAVILNGERGMVPEGFHDVADQMAELCASALSVPDDWKATWRRNYRWRGLSRTGISARRRTTGQPMVCFTGKFAGRERKHWIAEAEEHGWQATDAPSKFTDVLVVGELTKDSRKVVAARKNGTVIVSAEEWAEIMLDGVLPDRVGSSVE